MIIWAHETLLKCMCQSRKVSGHAFVCYEHLSTILIFDFGIVQTEQ